MTRQAIRNRAAALLGETQASKAEQEAAKAFTDGIRPVCDAVMAAIEAGDLAAFKGLRAMFAPMLVEINQEPELADILQREMGAALVEGITESSSTRWRDGEGGR
jgi:hypothetical protein